MATRLSVPPTFQQVILKICSLVPQNNLLMNVLILGGAGMLGHKIFQHIRVFVDRGPEANVCGDAAILGQAVDAVVLATDADGTRHLSSRKAKEHSIRAGIRILGTVLHNRSFPIPERL
jgi:hypothetical protein